MDFMDDSVYLSMEDPMFEAMMFDDETWASCIKLIEGTPPSELNVCFGEASVWLGKFRNILIGKLERLKDKDDVNMDTTLDWINKSKTLEKEFREKWYRQREERKRQIDHPE